MSPLREAFHFSRQHWQPLFVIALLFSLPSTAVELLQREDSTLLSGTSGALMSGLLVCLGVIQFATAMVYIHGRVQGQTPRLGASVALAISRLLPLLLVNLLMGLAVGLGLMLLVLPGLFMAYKLLFGEFLLLFHQRSPLDALKDSYRLTTGKAALILPPLSLWLGLVVLTSVLPYLGVGGSEEPPELWRILAQEAFAIALSIYGWALLYRLYQLHIASDPQLASPAVTPEPGAEQAPGLSKDAEASRASAETPARDEAHAEDRSRRSDSDSDSEEVGGSSAAAEKPDANADRAPDDDAKGPDQKNS